jgi:mRNA interferase HigB
MRVIARSTLMRFVETLKGKRERAAVESALRAWFHEAERAAWRNAADVKNSYATASIIDAERVVFNVKGNSYRLVTAIDFARQTVFIKWLGSHAEYDEINVRTVQYGDQAYQKPKGS